MFILFPLQIQNPGYSPELSYSRKVLVYVYYHSKKKYGYGSAYGVWTLRLIAKTNTTTPNAIWWHYSKWLCDNVKHVNCKKACLNWAHLYFCCAHGLFKGVCAIALRVRALDARFSSWTINLLILNNIPRNNVLVNNG